MSDQKANVLYLGPSSLHRTQRSSASSIYFRKCPTPTGQHWQAVLYLASQKTAPSIPQYKSFFSLHYLSAILFFLFFLPNADVCRSQSRSVSTNSNQIGMFPRQASDASDFLRLHAFLDQLSAPENAYNFDFPTNSDTTNGCVWPHLRAQR